MSPNSAADPEVVAILTAKSEYAVLIRVGGSPAWTSDLLSKVTSVVLPLVSGEPNWYLSWARYADYFETAV